MVFQVNKYDMANYVVSCALARKYRYTDEMGEYICTQCDKSLSAVNGDPPQMPRKADNVFTRFFCGHVWVPPAV